MTSVVIENVDDPDLVRLAVRLDQADQGLNAAIAANLIVSVTSDVGDTKGHGRRHRPGEPPLRH
jgi:hypothetical protein